MNKVKVTCRISDYSQPAKGSLLIHSHWNDKRLIEIQVGEERFTVSASEIKAAVENCTNTA